MSTPNMDTEPTFIYYLLDKSGSMWDRKDTVIRGMNEFLSEQKKITPCFLSLYTFNHELSAVYEGTPIEQIDSFNDQEYQPSGTTALYDAMGHLLVKTIDPKKPGKHILIVVTDGEENSSSHFRVSQIRELVTNNKQVELVYIGSNQDAILNAGHVGGQQRSALNYQDQNLDQAMRATSNAIHRYRTAQTPTVEFTQLEREVSQGVTPMDVDMDIGNTGSPTSPSAPTVNLYQ